MISEQRLAFWDIIEVFKQEGVLPYVMLIGSWAEYIYQFHFKSDFKPNLRTRDVDFLYVNLNRPKSGIKLFDKLKEKGFLYKEDRLSGVGKFVKEDLLELEFITRVLGKGQDTYKIPSIGIEAVGLRVVNMLADYQLELVCNGYTLIVPEPEAYVLQKLLTNPTRTPASKKEKDIQAVRALLKYVNKDRICQIFDEMPKKNQKTVDSVCKEYYIEITLSIVNIHAATSRLPCDMPVESNCNRSKERGESIMTNAVIKPQATYIIREESPADYAAVYALTQAAFAGMEHSDGTEKDMVERMRGDKAHVPELSLVAESGGELIGHIMFAKAAVGDSPALLLTIVSVLPKYQKHGIGAALVNKGHDIAMKMGYGLCLLVGHKDYYPRFGYEPAGQYKIEFPLDAPAECKLVRFLNDDSKTVCGTATFPAGYY